LPNNPLLKNAGISLVLGLVMFTVHMPGVRQAVYENALFVTIDDRAEQYVESTAKRAAVAFAVARSANAVISFFQDVEIGLAPGGVGVTIPVGEFLDPANDMIESFSWVMLASLTSLGIQRFLIEASPWLSLTILLTAASGLLFIGVWSRGRIRARCLSLGKNLVIWALFVRFAMPLVALANQKVNDLFLHDRYESSVAGIEAEKNNIDAIRAETTEVIAEEHNGGDEAEVGEEDSLWSEAKKYVSMAKMVMSGNAGTLSAAWGRLKERLGIMVDHLIDGIVVFVLGTMVLPLGFLYGLVAVVRSTLNADFAMGQQQSFQHRAFGAPPPAGPDTRRTGEPMT
jgi:hypothetical protein